MAIVELEVVVGVELVEVAWRVMFHRREIAGEGVRGYAYHPLDGRQFQALPQAQRKTAQPVAYDELAQVDYGDEEGGVFVPGDPVQHERFGRGVIQSLRGSGSQTKVEVRFADGSVRTIIASFLVPADSMEFL